MTADKNRRETLDTARELAAGLRALRKAIAENRAAVQHAIHNLLRRTGAPEAAERIMSTPATSPVLVDGPQFAAAIERLGPQDTDALARGEAVPIKAECLAEAMDGVEQLVYCCERPKLEWYGAPERPGIVCANCGFPVAHEGDILCWRGAEEQEPALSGIEPPQQAPALPPTPQRELF